MKKIYTVCAAAALLTLGLAGTALASPLKNYDAGKIAVDAGITLPSSIKGDNYKMSKSNSGYLGGTLGLGSNTALNYKWNNYKADQGKVRTHQLNLYYKVLPGISAYAGYLRADSNTDFGGRDQDSLQGGLQACYDIPALFTVWGNVGVGTKNTSLEIGISKPLFNNIDLNLSYYDNKFKDVPQNNIDVKAKGVNVGLTVKF